MSVLRHHHIYVDPASTPSRTTGEEPAAMGLAGTTGRQNGDRLRETWTNTHSPAIGRGVACPNPILSRQNPLGKTKCSTVKTHANLMARTARDIRVNGERTPMSEPGCSTARGRCAASPACLPNRDAVDLMARRPQLRMTSCRSTAIKMGILGLCE